MNVVALFVAMEAFVVQSAVSAPVTAHDFTFENIEGGALPLARFAGKPVLLVNTASMCGFTPQYEALQTIWEQYRDRGLVVLGVPSDDFGRQEYGSSAEIKQFCEINYGIDFPMTEKVKVKGPDAHPYYQWVKSQGGMKVPRWNFYKHVIDADGNLVEWFASTTAPDSRKVINTIEKLLPR
ncbi:MAG TPA: glutathione peroxidase [Alphaproteobacteria bacterium]|nr:MAG: glutathione peroxidase [SAR116 cluster bacterium MED-G06]HCV87727.1 glutathione peroxidase [Alphaproteobacteria bacterium]|tara:strand:+ start:84 stop:626 length:543 start_codon:yes stop_codon:yes gene_type:complete